MLNLSSEKGILLYGPPGVGKSYSMCALLRHYIVQGYSVERIVYDELCLKIRHTYTSGESELRLVRQHQSVDKLLIEDIGTTVGIGSQESNFSLRIFLLILDKRVENLKPTFITTNKSLDELGKSFDERVASRLTAACEVIPVKGRDKRKWNS